MEKINDQLSQEELAMVTGGASSSGLLSTSGAGDTRGTCTACKPGCVVNCIDGCAATCYDGCTSTPSK